MINSRRIRDILDEVTGQSWEDATKAIWKAGAADERAAIVAALQELSDEMIEAALRAAGTPDEALGNLDIRREMRAAIRAVGKFIERGEGLRHGKK